MRRVAYPIMLVMLLFCGCVATRSEIKVSRGYLPKIPMEPRPKMSGLTAEELAELKQLKEATQKKLIGNVELLMLWGKKQQISIEVYNNYVKVNNALVDKALGKKPVVEATSDE